MDKSKLEAVKKTAQQLLKFFTEIDAKSENFESVKVKDSDVTLSYGSLEVGAEIQISSPTGSEPAPNGEYDLENGSIITVVDGKISEIESQEEEVKEDEAGEDLADTPVADDKQPDAPAQGEDLKALEDRISKIEEAIKALSQPKDNAPSKEQLAAFESQMKELSKSISDLSKIPTQFSNDNRVEVRDTEMDRYKRIATGNK